MSASTQSGNATRSVDLSDIKGEIDRLSGIVADIASKRTRQAATAVDEGVDGLRGAIRQSPWISIGIASIVGIVIAVATASRSAPESRLDRMRRSARRTIDGFDARSFVPSVHVPSVQDIRSYMPDVASTRASFADRAEKLGNAIADIDPKNAVGPILEAARGISQAISRATKS